LLVSATAPPEPLSQAAMAALLGIVEQKLVALMPAPTVGLEEAVGA
jgi:hypothetical protein